MNFFKDISFATETCETFVDSCKKVSVLSKFGKFLQKLMLQGDKGLVKPNFVQTNIIITQESLLLVKGWVVIPG